MQARPIDRSSRCHRRPADWLGFPQDLPGPGVTAGASFQRGTSVPTRTFRESSPSRLVLTSRVTTERNKETAMAFKTKRRGAVREHRKLQQSGSAHVSSEDEIESGRRRVRRLPKIKGGELFEVTVLASRKAKARPIIKRRTRPRRHRKNSGR